MDWVHVSKPNPKWWSRAVRLFLLPEELSPCRISFEHLGFHELKHGETKRVQVKWSGDAVRWYPIDVNILHKLVTDHDPVKFVPELILPFDFVRDAENP